MIVLSLFDGIACGRVALERAKIPVTSYYASEIDKYAIKIANKNYPDIAHLGDIQNWRSWDIPKPDIIIGGSPCQGFSFAGKQLNFEDHRSKLFFVFADILHHYKPKYFLLENVVMKKDSIDVISNILGVAPLKINSALVSAQNRNRLYWTNIPKVTGLRDKNILLEDIIEHGYVDRDKSFCIDANYFKGGNPEQYFKKSGRQLVFEKPHGYNNGGFKEKDKFPTLRACTSSNYAILDNNTWRKLTPVECERLQTVPDNYTNHVSNAQRYKALGNGWTVDVVAHILKGIKKRKFIIPPK